MKPPDIYTYALDAGFILESISEKKNVQSYF